MAEHRGESALAEIGARGVPEFDGVHDVWPRGERLAAVRAAAKETRSGSRSRARCARWEGDSTVPVRLTALPRWRGLQARLADAAPRFGLWATAFVVASGRRAQRRLLRARERAGKEAG